ncbi:MULTISPECIES: GatB/YqeY domain-containing protein [unclassified Lentimicrobium]|uniref:GatB/YqeY domain-containing protein n=1 Tax=unclassified Lentimicrobium TaxID=2677434 RepID=UPI001555326A|nr:MULTISPECIES: GatB/YqeY domain-containing protein [unclassified Lentimicrobium]NPD44314.1 GatB/YqeY domain-containing protein [Lentimicrobium sp. S6]NPD84581.1 GatB/YqeY domain-containing protein [Lentimicrobium sp. L6]
MSLEILINNDIKAAMISKDKKKLGALRAIKAALLLEKTGKDTNSGEIPETVELKILQKLVKQRRESADIFTKQNRPELAEDEVYEADIIQAYLPQQMDEASLRKEIAEIIEITGASSMKDMGKLMGMASKKFAGKADSKTISSLVKELLLG